MNKRILNTLLLGTVLFTSAVEAKSFNFKEYEVDISIDSEEVRNGSNYFNIAKGLGLLGLAGSFNYMGLDLYRSIKEVENTDIVKLMSKKAELVNIQKSLVDKVDSLEQSRNLRVRQAHIERAISNLIHAGEDSLAYMYAPVSIHKKIIVNRIADTILDDGLRLDRDIRFAVVKNIESKIDLGSDLTNNMNNSDTIRKVSMLETEYRLITADAKVDDMGMVHRSIKISAISKSIREDLVNDLRNVHANLEDVKLGKTAVANKIESLEKRIQKLDGKVYRRKNYGHVEKESKKAIKVMGALGAVTYVSGAYLMYEVGSKLVEIEVLENGNTRLISIEEIL